MGHLKGGHAIVETSDLAESIAESNGELADSAWRQIPKLGVERGNVDTGQRER